MFKRLARRPSVCVCMVYTAHTGDSEWDHVSWPQVTCTESRVLLTPTSCLADLLRHLHCWPLHSVYVERDVSPSYWPLTDSYTHIHTYTHLHTHTHTHTHTPRSISRLSIVHESLVRKTTCTDTHRHIHIHTHTHICVRARVCEWANNGNVTLKEGSGP